MVWLLPPGGFTHFHHARVDGLSTCPGFAHCFHPVSSLIGPQRDTLRQFLHATCNMPYGASEVSFCLGRRLRFDFNVRSMKFVA